jgi:hypothetical protein
MSMRCLVLLSILLVAGGCGGQETQSSGRTDWTRNAPLELSLAKDLVNLD